jgi:transposase
MESTGLYWLGLAQLLSESGIEVVLVNARHVRHLPGRKSDVLDCQWLQYLHSVGLLRGSFRPADHLCALRSLTRHRDSLVSQAADQVRHAQKALTQMNLQLHHVIDDLTGATGSAIVEAILAGERDPLALAKLRNPNIKASAENVAKSLHGHWREEHLLVLRLAWETHAHYRMQITTLETEIHRRTLQLQKIAGTADDEQPPAPEGAPVPSPHVPAPKKRKGGKSKNQPILSESLRASYQRIFGCDLTLIPSINILTVQALLSEVGPDLSAFPTASAFASWAGLCPGTKISGGRALSTRSRPGKPRIAKMLRQSALGLHRSASALGERYRRLRTRLGAPKALTAMAHMILRIIYKLVREGLEYDDSIYAKIEAENRKNRVHRLEANAKKRLFGF